MGKVSQSSKNGVKKDSSQVSRVRKLLMDLAPDVTKTDRKDAIENLGVSKPTISKYLSGQVMDIETALLLCGFFSSKIKLREEKLNNMPVCQPSNKG